MIIRRSFLKERLGIANQESPPRSQIPQGDTLALVLTMIIVFNFFQTVFFCNESFAVLIIHISKNVVTLSIIAVVRHRSESCW